MTRTIPTYEPAEIVAGETLQWRKDLVEYAPADGWALTYYFRNADGSGFDATGATDGSGWLVSVPAATTLAVKPGRLDWQAWVEQGSEKYLVEQGTTTVRKGFADGGASTAVDGRTQAEQDLAAVRSALAGQLDKLEYTIANRSLRYHSREDLIKLEHNLAQRVNGERRAARIRDGGSFFQQVKVRFN